MLTRMLLALAICPTASSLPAQTADTIYLHGNILTGENLDGPHAERVSAIAVAHGYVIGAGTDTSIESRFKGPHTQLVDLGGHFAMPGFNDAHTHMGEAGHIKLSVNLIGASSLTEMEQRIAAAASLAPAGAWLTGGGWDHTLWPSKTLPTRYDLDKVTAGHPAIFSRVDGHIAVANSAALAAGGITRNTADPHGGKIDHGRDGEPTGILRETPARQLVEQHIPPPTAAEMRKGVELAIADAISHGVTTVQDNTAWAYFPIYEQMEREGRLPLRISEWLAFDDAIDTLKAHRAAHPANDRMLRTTMLKGFMDGSLGSRTAAMIAPYSDDPTNSGLPRYEQQQLNQMAIAREQAGFQMGFHAIGDRAVDMALNAFAAAQSHAPLRFTITRKSYRQTSATPTGFRNRIEHSQVVSPGDFARYKQLGVIASMQPNHLLTDMNWASARLGAERSKYAYAWKSFLDAGVPLAFGTDYPVEPITPFRGVYSAVTRMNDAGTMTFHPEQKLTIWQTLYAYTQGSAYAEFAERWKGKLAPGYVADFIVLDRDLTHIPAPQILKTQVLRTVVGGRTVYTSGK
ncbi:amidohydrolase [Acidipila rosea]|uniref:Amidohydrolase 3 domain-containing protein n=1 Tax=Acidipila rosea TaxID=768535 RepID=A0A4R1L054_9BACT|nr:amidohydrolase [Acidipila rosea]TCK70193.1 hypothetical protein C7378_3348 [Acidipila rosea]